MTVKSSEEFLAALRKLSPKQLLPIIRFEIVDDISMMKSMALFLQEIEKSGEHPTQEEQDHFYQIVLNGCESIFNILHAAEVYDKEQRKSE